MGKHLQRELVGLKKKFLKLSTVVEEILIQSIQAFETMDKQKAEAVIEKGKEVDLLEIELEEECLKTLALYQPMASDLRFIVSMLKINSDLERIGDLAENICERVIYLSDKEKVNIDVDYNDMMANVLSMLKKTLDAFVNMDAELAKEVCRLDEIVDDYRKDIFNYVSENIKTTESSAQSMLNMLSISRYLERIADHITNVAEDIIYLVDGEIIRHSPELSRAS